MALCEDDFELTKFSYYLGSLYVPKLSMHVGRKHDSLGVDMKFCKDGALGVSMFKYLRNVIKEFLEKITGQAAMPAGAHLFEIRDVRRKHDRWGRNRPWRSITQWRSYFSWPQELGKTSRRPWHSLPLE